MELLQKKAELVAKQRNLIEDAKKDLRDLTEAEKAEFDEAQNQINTIDNLITMDKGLATVEDAMDKPIERPFRPASPEDPAKAAHREQFVNFLRGNLPKNAVTRAANGEALIPETLYEKIIEGVKMYGGIRAARVTTHSNLIGTINLPVANDTNKGHRTSTGAATAVDPTTLTSVPLTPWEYTSDIAVIDRSLLDGTPTDVEKVLANILSERVAKIVNEECTTGTGTGMPKGILAGATKGADAAATDAITDDELTDLEHSVPAQFRPNAQWMFNDNTLKHLKKKKDGDGRPLWQPGLVAGDPATFKGYTYVINNDMPDIGAGAKPVLFGDFSRYHVGDGLNWSIRVLNELYAANNQVGLVLFSMHGGTYADAAGAVKYLLNAAS